MTKKQVTPATSWRLLSPALATTREATLFFRRSHGHGPPATARGLTIAKHLDEWRAADPGFLALQALRDRERTTVAELAEAETRLAEARDNLAITLVVTTDDSTDAEALVVTAENKIKSLNARLAVIKAELPETYRLAFQTYALLTSSISEAEMAAAKPALEAVVLELERVVSPLLDALYAARRAYDESGRNFPEPSAVLGNPPPSGKPERQPQPGDIVPVLVDNRVPERHRQPVRGPEQTATHDRVFPIGHKPWHQRM
jgi:hypothetical protein